MSRIGIVLLAGGIVASSLVACIKPPPSMSLDSATVTKGHDVVVRFNEPLAGKVADLYWIALVPVESPDPTATNRVVVEHGMTTIRLPATTPGSYEVRLHDRYPEKEYRLIARAPVMIVD